MLTFAVVGAAGGIAGTHLEALKKLKGAKVVGLSDLPVAAARGTERATEFGCPFFTDHAEMLKAVKPDVVVIATPHPQHAPVALDAFRAGAHVLTEKPLAVTVAEADGMIAAAEEAGKLLAVNYQMRTGARTKAARRLVDEGKIGGLIRVLCVEPWYRTEAYYRSASWRGTWKGEGGGVLMNQAPHTMDLMCHLAGLPKTIWGWTRLRYHTMECEDSAQAMFQYANGAPGYLAVSTVEAGSTSRLEVIGDRGGLEIVNGELWTFSFDPPLLDHMRTSPGSWETPKFERRKVDVPKGGGGHLDIYEDLVAAIRDGRRPIAGGRESLQSLEFANAIMLSSFENRPVTTPVDRAAMARLMEDLKSGKRTQPKA